MGLPQTSTEAAEALKKYGQQQYKDGKFEEALIAFNQALDVLGSARVDILDGRAATYCKLGQFSKAYADGRRMIKLEKNNHQGYLRTASVLCKMESLQKAHELLQYAVRTLPTESAYYEDVVKATRSVATALHGPRLIDPSRTFPFEVIRMIMQQLTLRERILLRRVSKSWLSLCSSMPEFYREIDCTLSPKKRLTSRSVARALDLSRFSPTKLTLARLAQRDVERIMDYLCRCDTLQEVKLLSPSKDWAWRVPCGNWRDLRSLCTNRSAAVPPDELCDVWRSLPNLEKCVVWLMNDPTEAYDEDPKPMLHLRSLSIYCVEGSDALSYIYMDDFNTHFPALEELYLTHITNDHLPNLSGCNNLRRLGLLECWSYDDDTTVSLPDGLEHISFSKSQIPFADSSWAPHNLKSLVWNAACRGSHLLAHLLTNFSKNLVYLDLERSVTETVYTAFEQSMKAGNLSALTELNVAGNGSVSFKLVESMISHMPNLKRLDISHTLMEDWGLVRLAKAESIELEKLVCDGLGTSKTYREAIQHARSRGIEVPTAKKRSSVHDIRMCAM